MREASGTFRIFRTKTRWGASYVVMRPPTSLLRTFALAAIVAVVISAPGAAGAETAGAGQKPSAPITIRVELDRTRVVAGTPIKGTVVVTNGSSKTIVVQQCAIDGWLAVGLANKTTRFAPAFALVGCAPSVPLKPGRNRFPVKVLTTSQSCLQPGGRSTTFIAKCLSSGSSFAPPPLPPGRYWTKVVTLGLPPNATVGHPVAVSLLRAGR